ncbi:hypothetical protein FACS1894105_08630 [Clostridia bacterium]|nr:hypothetical protein FACS1894105_08630 [Clostridia bacterium]
MYQLENFGKRVEEMRKKKGFTQGDLAEKLRISTQAVSKWENELSYPDITTIPDLCAIFGCTADWLFGRIESEIGAGALPDTYLDLPLAAEYNGIGCYSSKIVASVNGGTVVFADGSTAEIGTMSVVNRGKGEVKFTKSSIEEKIIMRDYEMIKTEYEFDDAFDGFDIETNLGNFTVVESVNGKCGVSIECTADIRENIVVDTFQENGMGKTVRFRTVDLENRNLDDKTKLNVVLSNVSGHTADGNSMNYTCNGSGIIKSAVDFGKINVLIHGSGHAEFPHNDYLSDSINIDIHGSGVAKAGNGTDTFINIHGSGDVELGNCTNNNSDIHGSGKIRLGEVAILESSIHGSGDIKVVSVSQSVNIEVHGSGDYKIGSGSVKEFNASLHGGGRINADKVATDKAEIEVRGGGSLRLGRVRHESIEQYDEGADVVILERGDE